MRDGDRSGQGQRFFVSYTGRDESWAEWVAWTLEAAGHEVLIQAWDFGPGSHFVGEMQRALDGSRRTVVVLSAAYLESAFATEEWQAVWAADPAGAQKLLLVVRVEDCDRPGLLRQIVSRDLFGVRRETARDRLLDAVAVRRRKPEVEPAFPAEAAGVGEADGAGPMLPVGAGAGLPAELPAVWNVPPRLARFVGREVVLDTVAGELSARGVAAVCAVQGAGGVGKSAVAVEYAHRHMAAFDVVWWVAAQDPELIAGHVAALGVEVGLDEGAGWPAVAGVLRRRRLRWLLVLDNVDDPEVVWPFRPSDPRGRLLVTSRLAGVDDAVVEVAEFDQREAVGLLTGRVAGIDPAVAGRIVGLLGCLPLAVEQAAGYLRQTGMPAGEYAQLLAGQLGNMLGRGRVAGRPGVTVANLWELSMARLRGERPAAVALMEVCAVCAPDPIPLDLFTGGGTLAEEGLRGVVGDPVVWADTVGALVGYSLARRDGQALVVHRLIAAATRAGMDADRRAGAAATAVGVLREALPADVRDPVGWPRWRALLPHVRAVLDGHDGGSGNVVAGVSWLCDRTGLYLAHHGRPDIAIPYLARGLALDIDRVGPDHPDTLSARHNLAGAYETAGRVQEAIGLFEQVLTDTVRVLGPDHPHTLTARANLAYTYRTAGRVQEAIGLFEQVLTDR
ncbi:FxSxx-COOH system tetratricopeptide repeat protein, partial [Frankia sp. CiP3]|uniref:FxSxx-COOH system tetratricopeptide repeat protein n=1 Tax=Frankia sp. CiP3 TaxID=2880971 RepID=UPI001EF5A885